MATLKALTKRFETGNAIRIEAGCLLHLGLYDEWLFDSENLLILQSPSIFDVIQWDLQAFNTPEIIENIFQRQPEVAKNWHKAGYVENPGRIVAFKYHKYQNKSCVWCLLPQAEDDTAWFFARFK